MPRTAVRYLGGHLLILVGLRRDVQAYSIGTSVMGGFQPEGHVVLLLYRYEGIHQSEDGQDIRERIMRNEGVSIPSGRGRGGRRGRERRMRKEGGRITSRRGRGGRRGRKRRRGRGGRRGRKGRRKGRERRQVYAAWVTFSLILLVTPTTGTRLYTVTTPYLEHVVRAEALVRAASMRVFRECVQQNLVVPLRQQRKRQHTQHLPPVSYYTRHP